MQWHENLAILTFLGEDAGVEVRRLIAERQIMKTLAKAKEQDFECSKGNTVIEISVRG